MNSREYERLERRMRTRRKNIIASVIAGIFIVAAVAAIILVVLSLNDKTRNSAQPEATVAVTEQPTLYTPAQNTVPSSVAKTEAGQTPTYARQDDSAQQSETEAQLYTENVDPQSSAEKRGGPQDATSSPHEPLPLPEAVAGALHFYADGGTTEGFNWTYSSYGTVANITCVYNFTQRQYDFIISGITPGTTSFTLVYYASDNDRVEVPMTVSVDEYLNVTRIG